MQRKWRVIRGIGMVILESKVKIIMDNPNLSVSELARFLDLNVSTVGTIKRATCTGSKWKHSGCGIPFLSKTIGKRGLIYKLRAKNRTVVSCSSFDSAMENLDRLIYCLENNNGKLPKSTSDFVFGGLEFIGRSA